MKLKRLKEWLTVMREERVQVNVWKIVKALTRGRVTRAQWRERMRVCGKCPIYDRTQHKCRFQDLGCGCWVPAMGWMREPYRGENGRGCWGRAVVGEGFGWGTKGKDTG